MAKKVKDILKDIGYEINSAIGYILDRPIGIVNKQFQYAQTAIDYSPWFGGGDRKFITSKGQLVNIEPNFDNAWYMKDAERKNYEDYISYIEQQYYGGKKNVVMDLGVSMDDILTRQYDTKQDILNSGLAILRDFGGQVSHINPNTYDKDTRLGEISAFFLNQNDEYKKTALDHRYQRNHWLTSQAYSQQFSMTSKVDITLNFDKEIGTYSGLTNEAIVDSLNQNTQNYVFKSMLGYDLQKFKDKTFSIQDLTKVNGTRKQRTANNTYLNAIVGSVSLEGGRRYNFKDVGNSTLYDARTLYTYAEKENGVSSPLKTTHATVNSGVRMGTYQVLENMTKKDLLAKTNENFKNGKYKTLIARFHTDKVDANDITSTAISSEYGMSHGRNLLSGKKVDTQSGYSNPYCRVWTYHQQYAKLKDTIRPFTNKKQALQGINAYRADNWESRLDTYGVKGKNGLVRFTPTQGASEDVKKCMFSIENLAWKGDHDKLGAGQVGPHQGRIMWFPPYDLKFSENVNSNWGEVDFIGRGEKIYTYTNTDRSGTLSFKLLIDHPSILNKWRNNGNREKKGGDDVLEVEQEILRFFAGCDVMSEGNTQREEKEEKQFPPKEDIEQPTQYKKLKFKVYFPNNYSGIDDGKTNVSKPIIYLLNGVGCDIIENGQKTKDLPNSIGEKWSTTISGKNTIIGGYEMRNGIGVSGKFSFENWNGNHSKDVTSFKIKSSKNNEYTCVPYTDTKNKQYKWGHRIDKASEGEKLIKRANYSDTKSHKLNYTGYKSGMDKKQPNEIWCSFYDFYRAITQNKVSNIQDTNSTNVIKKLCNDITKGQLIKEIHVSGYATAQGSDSKNIDLAQHRCETVTKWLKQVIKTPNVKYQQFYDKPTLLEGAKNNENINVKKLKSALVTIYYAEEELAYDYDNGSATQNTVNGNYSEALPQTKARASNGNGNTNTTTTSKKTKGTPQAQPDNIVDSWDSRSVEVGYGNEFQFFQELEMNDTFLHNKIVDKIKYFDPAFHSITPEGFQARLTFLHQCTRQGKTHSASDINTDTTADNLAFGRPPVCVLRIGDFYYTKIIIKSLNIKYDQGGWDLNDEGIGVMPMMADIDINFVFIGGSDISGPIARLQNAVSFNYYANTSIYDNRAEFKK